MITVSYHRYNFRDRVYYGWMSQHLRGFRKDICCWKTPQFAVTKGYNIWKVTETGTISMSTCITTFQRKIPHQWQHPLYNILLFIQVYVNDLTQSCQNLQMNGIELCKTTAIIIYCTMYWFNTKAMNVR